VLKVGLAVALLACRQERAPQTGGIAVARLRTDAASVCDPSRQLPLVLELPAAGGFRLNRQALDSAELARWLRDGQARRDPAGRLVFVRADSLRARELGWLVPAIERAGGRAYEPDTACVRPVRAPIAGAPAA
jgi:hypothetical protein